MNFLNKNYMHYKTTIFNMSKIIFLSLIFCSSTMISCSSDDDGTPVPVQNDVTYTGDVKAILDASCLNCHDNPVANGAPMSLTTFDEAKEAVSNRNLIGRVEDGSMPPAGTDLSAAQVQTIKDWQAGGFKQ